MSTVIIHGPSGCGKTHNAQRLSEFFGCRSVVDGWGPDDQVVGEALHLTNCKPSHAEVGPHVRILSYDRAIAACGGVLK